LRRTRITPGNPYAVNNDEHVLVGFLNPDFCHHRSPGSWLCSTSFMQIIAL
jgi:hypothetical protein